MKFSVSDWTAVFAGTLMRFSSQGSVPIFWSWAPADDRITKSWNHSKLMQLVHNTYIHVHIFRLHDHFFLFHAFFWCRLTCPIWCQFYAKHLRYLEVVPVNLLWAILVLSWDVYCFSTDYRLIRLLWNGQRFLQDFSLGLPRNRVYPPKMVPPKNGKQWWQSFGFWTTDSDRIRCFPTLRLF